METNKKLVYDIPEVGRLLGLSRTLTYRLIHTEGFPLVRLGEKRLAVPVDGLQRWLDNQAVKNEGR